MLLPASFRTTNPLANLSVKHINSLDSFAALKIFPPHLVPQNSFKWYLYGKENLKLPVLDAPSGSESHRFDYSATTASGLAKEYGAKHLILGKDARDFDRPVADLMMDAAQNNAQYLMNHMEQAAYTKVSTAGSYISGLTAALTNTWSGGAGDPVEDIRAQRQAVYEACGKRPNVLAINQKSLDYLKNHSAIVDRIKYIGMVDPATVRKAIAQLLELEEIVISDAVKNTANDGAADVLATIWGSVSLLFVRDMSASLRSMQYGRTFIVNNLATKTLPRPELARGDLSADELETSWEWCQEFVAQDSTGDTIAGYLATGLY